MENGIILSVAFFALALLVGACGVGGYYAIAGLARLAHAVTITAWGA